MKRIQSRVAAAALGLAFCAGCASVYVQNAHEYPSPKPDQGLVFFYREEHHIGHATKYYVYEGDSKVGGLRNGSYFFIWVAPGTHTYSDHLKGHSTVTLEVAPDKVYFVRSDVSPGWLGPSAPLIEVTASEADRSIQKLHEVGLTRAK